MTEPFVKSGTLDGDGLVNVFVPPSSALLSGITFLGNTVENPDGSVTVSGTWTISKGNIHGNGTWSITRAPLAT